MVSLLDQAPFPFSDPAARQLHLLLCEIFPDAASAIGVAVRAGIPAFHLNVTWTPYVLWDKILTIGANLGVLRKIVAPVLAEFPNSPRASFLRALLDGREHDVPLDAQAASASGEPHFLVDDDRVFEPEALLFRDDLTIEVGRLPWLIAALQRLDALRGAVCQLVTECDGESQNGTGFLIAPDLVLTNWHVLHIREARVDAIRARFHFEDDGAGGTRAVRATAGDPAIVAGDAADDWAVFRLAEAPADHAPVLDLAGAAEPVTGSAAFIIQHPSGAAKRLAYARNQIVKVHSRVIHYLSDTRPGSSGSPVLDAQGRLIALHRAGGLPQTALGKPPMRKNEGVRATLIAEALAQRGDLIAAGLEPGGAG